MKLSELIKTLSLINKNAEILFIQYKIEEKEYDCKNYKKTTVHTANYGGTTKIQLNIQQRTLLKKLISKSKFSLSTFKSTNRQSLMRILNGEIVRSSTYLPLLEELKIYRKEYPVLYLDFYN